MTESKKFGCIDGFAEELDEVVYEGLSNWLFSFRSLTTVFFAHFSYLIIFIAVLCCGVLSLRHAKENGGRYLQFWWGAMLHGIVSENGLLAPRYWHAQAPIMLLGKHLPLHTVFYYPSLLYLAMMAAHRLKLSLYTEPAAVGLITMLMDVPFKIISVKFLHVTYHDSDPAYVSKIYGVPWIEILSSLIFASSYVAVFHGMKINHIEEDYDKWDLCGCGSKETLLTALAGVLGPLGGFLQKLVFFHFFHDNFKISAATCWLLVLCIYIAIVLCDDSSSDVTGRFVEEPHGKPYLTYQICIFFGCLLFLALAGKPQNEVSIGSHEPTGDCTTLIYSRAFLGKAQKRRKYLCADEIVTRPNFVYNFDCVPNGPPCLNAIWYTICGTKLRNRFDFFLIVFSFVVVVLSFFLNVLFDEAFKKFMLKHGYRRHLRSEERGAEPSKSENEKKSTIT